MDESDPDAWTRQYQATDSMEQANVASSLGACWKSLGKTLLAILQE
jgi:hypothetical protein